MANVNNSCTIGVSKPESTTKLKAATETGALRSFISLISSACSSAEDGDTHLSASQIHDDFSLAAQCERNGDLSIDNIDQGFFDLFRSSTYWTLRETFVKAALAGDEYAFMTAIWRGYNAGRVSPDRFVTNTKKNTQTTDASTTSDRARRAVNAK